MVTLKLGNNFAYYNNKDINPKNVTESDIIRINRKRWISIKPNSFVLAHSMETVSIESNQVGIILSKYSLASIGIISTMTVLEPGWAGEVTFELWNTTPLPVKITIGLPIVDLLLVQTERCAIDYKKRNGKYMNQTNVTLPK